MTPVRKVIRATQDRRVLRAQQVRQALQDHRDLLVRQGRRGLRARKVNRDRQGRKDRKAIKVIRVTRVMTVSLSRLPLIMTFPQSFLQRPLLTRVKLVLLAPQTLMTYMFVSFILVLMSG